MKLINNITDKLGDDLKVTIKRGDRLSIAAATFSVYAFEELKEQLEGLEELRFIFTSPTFLEEKPKKSQREFYIPQLNREKTLHGSEFEIRLRNDLSQRAIALECARWIKEKVTFKSNTTMQGIPGMICADGEYPTAYAPVNAFTRAELGCERGENMVSLIQQVDAPMSQQYLDMFNKLWNDKQNLTDVTDKVLDSITNAFKENSPEFLYFFALYNIFGSFLEEVDTDHMPNEKLGFKESKIWSMLYTFQKDAVLAIISKLEQFNGCILADSVGLGKTFTALAVIKYYELRNMRVLVLCPKKLSDNWRTYKANYINNPIAEDRLRYDVLYHTDLSRDKGFSGEIDLSKLNWSGYDLIVIDESHNFRNGGSTSKEGKENRYDRLMNKVIKSGARTRVLMLSATPVNNRFTDLRNQLALAYEGDALRWSEQLETSRNINEILSGAQHAFNDWNKLDENTRTSEQLMRMLDFDFFKVLDAVTIARSRKHIERYYNVEEIGRFPNRRDPVTKQPPLTDLSDTITFKEINDKLERVSLCIYTPTSYVLDSCREKYEGSDTRNLTQSGREQGMRTLMATNLLKRLESSVYAFRITLQRIKEAYDDTYDPMALQHLQAQQMEQEAGQKGFAGFINRIADIAMSGRAKKLRSLFDPRNFDADDQESYLLIDRKGNQIALNDMDYLSYQQDLSDDLVAIEEILQGIEKITPEHDTKLQTLLHTIDEKVAQPFNADNRKILIFTAFADTATYLFEHVSTYMTKRYGLHTALVTGSEGRSTIQGLTEFNDILTCFSPRSKDKAALMPDAPEIEILIATDCISEGQNLQDCDCVINYDIHWNPVRLVQRFGRIDRIGSQNETIQMINFWPDMDLDSYLNLKVRVESRMKAVVLTSTGDDNLLSPEEKGDLEYRRKQLEQLQHKVVDLEDMGTGVTITDLGLTEFRMELMEYAKQHPELEITPGGISAVTPAQADASSGVIFVLKNVHNEVNINDRNRIHPYYLVYLSDDGDIIYDHLAPRDILETMRQLCRGKTEPIVELCAKFERETAYGEDMDQYSTLLNDAVESIVDTKEDSDLESLFRAGGTTALLNEINGLDDFQLICFLVVKEM